MRVLVTGVGGYWGGRLAEVLEADPEVEVIVGIDTRRPGVTLARTEVVRVDSSYSMLARVVAATEVDTVIHTHLDVDSTATSERALHETNVIGTMNLLAAAGTPASTVRRVVIKSSTLVYGTTHRDPYWFSEEAGRSGPARTRVERSLLEAEGAVSDFAEDHPEVDVALLRCSNVLGTDLDTALSRALRRRFAPEVFGFDPRMQFTHPDDVLGALGHAARTPGLAGTFNVAGAGVLAWSDICRLVGRRRAALPPWFTDRAAGALRTARLVDLPPEIVGLLRYGRGVDTRRLREAGYEYRYTSRGAVEDFARHLRLEATVGAAAAGHRFDPAAEDFFRRSPAVTNRSGPDISGP